jgi:hypothetical protein
MPTSSSGCSASFPKDPFLIVRFGDHQPYISSKMIEPGKDIAEVTRSIAKRDPRYFTTYYAIDAVNYRPRICPRRSIGSTRPICRSRCWSGGPAARCLFRRAEGDHAALRRRVLRLQGRRRGAPLQTAC